MKQYSVLNKTLLVLTILSVVSLVYLYSESVENGQVLSLSLKTLAEETFLPGTKLVTTFIISVIEAIIF